MAQFQLKLSKIDATILGRLLEREEGTILSHFIQQNDDIQKQERLIIEKYLSNLTQKLLEFGNDERYEQTEKATKIDQYDFVSKIRVKLFKEKYGLEVVSKSKRQKILEVHGINDATQLKPKRKNRQVDLLELIEEVEKEQENQLKP